MLTLALALASLVTATLSGVFGMAGGMLLMGVYTALLPVPTAMVMHGGTQLVSNASRALMLRGAVDWRGFGLYVLGALAALALMFSIQYVPDPIVVLLGLGLAPFVAAVVPARLLDFQRPHAAVVCGFAVAALQLIAGAAGPLLDVAFLESRMTRQQIVATKAVTQVFSHSLKLVYFVPAVERGSVTPMLACAVLVATLVGTRLGTYLLHRLSERSFRRYSRAIVYAIGLGYLCKAGLELLR